MYRQTNKASKNYRKSYTNRKSDIEQESFVEPQNIPELRRIIEITDYDSGEPNDEIKSLCFSVTKRIKTRTLSFVLNDTLLWH